MNKVKRHEGQIILWGVLVGILAIFAPVSGAQTEGWFITPEEAAMSPGADVDPLQGGGEINIGRDDLELGPVIEVQKPVAGSPQHPPIAIVVTFTSRAYPIDLSTLKVGLVKWITLDITDRVAEYVTEKGIRRDDVKIPSGSHRVRISLADTTGAVSSKEFLFEVP